MIRVNLAAELEQSRPLPVVRPFARAAELRRKYPIRRVGTSSSNYARHPADPADRSRPTGVTGYSGASARASLAFGAMRVPNAF